MADYEASTYGDRIAAVYDQFHFPVTRFTNATVEFLASAAGKRRVLELGIGTGRIALPMPSGRRKCASMRAIFGFSL